ncbi:MAG: hypothetical protein RLZZ272_104 [Actinomycetota bacterium]
MRARVVAHLRGTVATMSAQRPTASPDDGSGPAVEYGPSGHLPARAAARARKIVLRAPLGRSWIVASVVAGLVVIAASGGFLVRASAPPGPPWIELGALEALPPESRPAGTDVVLLTVGGRVRAFIDADGVRWCRASNRLETEDGRVWALTGRGFGGTDSLATRPTLVHRGVVHLDPTTTVPGAAPTPEPMAPACR